MQSSFSNTLSRWVLPGLLAGVAFLAVALISGAMTPSLWAMPDAIAQTVGVAAPADYRFALAPVVVGIAIHLTLSVGLGALFTAIAAWRKFQGWSLVVAAFIFITLETPIVLWGILHTVLSAATFHYYLSAITIGGSVLGHYLYALCLGLLVARYPVTRVAKPVPSVV